MATDARPSWEETRYTGLLRVAVLTGVGGTVAKPKAKVLDTKREKERKKGKQGGTLKVVYIKRDRKNKSQKTALPASVSAAPANYPPPPRGPTHNSVLQ